MNAANIGKKTNQKKQSKFQALIQSLRNKVIFKLKDENNCDTTLNHKPSQIINNANDILPVTQCVEQNARSFSVMGNQHQGINPEDNSSNIINKYHDMESTDEKTYIDIQSDFNSERQDRQSFERFNKQHYLLQPEKTLNCPKRQGRVGGIAKQSLSVNRNYKQHQGNKKQTYIQQLAPILTAQQQYLNSKKSQYNIQSQKNTIKMLDDVQLIKYLNISKKLTEKSYQNEISNLFQGIIDVMNISINEPCIKKYKNCVYFGDKPLNNEAYEGFIYYFQDKIYYGQLLNGIKHGHGVQINFKNNSKYAGTFHEGKKVGYFFVQKDKQNYQGEIQFGIYHGEGKLMTEDYVYTGSFQNGKKHGYGQQVYPKTGLKLQGYFNNGIYSNLSQISKIIDPTSQSELSNKLEDKMTKSKSYLINFQIVNKKYGNKNVFNNKFLQQKRLSPQSTESKEDSQSLFDMISKNQRVNKYDINFQGILKKLPKIYVNDLLSKQSCKSSPQHIIINKKIKQANNQLTNYKLYSLNRKTKQYSSKASFVNEVQQPLSKRSFIKSLNFSKN